MRLELTLCLPAFHASRLNIGIAEGQYEVLEEISDLEEAKRRIEDMLVSDQEVWISYATGGDLSNEVREYITYWIRKIRSAAGFEPNIRQLPKSVVAKPEWEEG